MLNKLKSPIADQPSGYGWILIKGNQFTSVQIPENFAGMPAAAIGEINIDPVWLNSQP
jgi:hypothetical protein